MRAFAQMLQSLLALYGFGPKVHHRRRDAIHIGHTDRRFV
jgi:hypothetical protein